MSIAEVKKTEREIPNDPQIQRFAHHADHMKFRWRQAEAHLRDAIRIFQENCEHEFEDVLGDNPHYDGPARIGQKCKKCLIFLKR